MSAHFGSTYTKIGTIQRRLAWPLRKDDTQIREAFHILSWLGAPLPLSMQTEVLVETIQAKLPFFIGFSVKIPTIKKKKDQSDSRKCEK